MDTVWVFVLGAVTPVLVMAAVAGLYMLLTILFEAFVRVTTVLGPDRNQARRAWLGAMMFAADRSWRIRSRRASIVVIWTTRKTSDRGYKDALRALQDVEERP